MRGALVLGCISLHVGEGGRQTERRGRKTERGRLRRESETEGGRDFRG